MYVSKSNKDFNLLLFYYWLFFSAYVIKMYNFDIIVKILNILFHFNSMYDVILNFYCLSFYLTLLIYKDYFYTF